MAGMPLEEYCQSLGCKISQEERTDIAKEVCNAAYEIIALKGSTFYAVAVGLLRIVESILRSQNSILTVSNLISDYYGIDNVYLSLPAIINERGIRNLLQLNLNDVEQTAFLHSANKLRDVLDQLEIQPSVEFKHVRTIHPDLKHTAK